MDEEFGRYKRKEKEITEHISRYIQLITDNHLEGTETGDVIRSAVGTTGKMVRPKLLLLCSGFGPDHKEKYERLCMTAAMVELTHAASLVHDDIIDDSDLRRGKPSVQAKYGKDAAVYAGDFILSRVTYWELKEKLYDAALMLSRTMEEMCRGEIGQDLCKYREDVTCEEYLQNIIGKTAWLFRTACMLGAMEAGCDKETVEKLGQFGEYFGIMFQFRDDVLDYTATQKEAGKDTHKDFNDGIYTIPVLMAMRSPEARRKLIPLMRMNRRRQLTVEEMKKVEEAVIRYGGVKQAKDEIRRYIQLAIGVLKELRSCTSARVLVELLHEIEKE